MTKQSKQNDTSPTNSPAIAFIRMLANVFSFGSRTDVKSKHKTFLNIFLKGLYFIFCLSCFSSCNMEKHEVGISLLLGCAAGFYIGFIGGCAYQYEKQQDL